MYCRHLGWKEMSYDYYTYVSTCILHNAILLGPCDGTLTSEQDQVATDRWSDKKLSGPVFQGELQIRC